MKKLFLLLPLIMFIAACGPAKSDSSEQESAEPQWLTLFDGSSLDAWEMFGEDPITPQWAVEDGILKCRSNPEIQPEAQRSIMTKDQFSDFELELDFMVTENANSGIMYHVVEGPEYNADYETGPEYQVLDDNENPDRRNINRLASNYDMHAPADDKPFKGVGEWNTAKIVYQNGHVEHWLNGVKVLEFEENSDDWKARKAASKWANVEGYAKYKTGHISLQDHGGEVWYRNIRIKKL